MGKEGLQGCRSEALPSCIGSSVRTQWQKAGGGSIPSLPLFLSRWRPLLYLGGKGSFAAWPLGRSCLRSEWGWGKNLSWGVLEASRRRAPWILGKTLQWKVTALAEPFQVIFTSIWCNCPWHNEGVVPLNLLLVLHSSPGLSGTPCKEFRTP